MNNLFFILLAVFLSMQISDLHMQITFPSRAAGVRPCQRRLLLSVAGTDIMSRGCLACCAGSRGCIFCDIVKAAGSSVDSRVLYQDDLVVVIPDIRPAAAVHLLVLPKAHIPNVDSLAASDAQLVRHMAEVGERLLQQQDQQLQLPQPAQHKFGFHKPPFRSVDHLHLHCFTLPHRWYRWVQYQSDLNWITVDGLLDQLSRLPSATPHSRS